jgi:hypothetical protein
MTLWAHVFCGQVLKNTQKVSACAAKNNWFAESAFWPSDCRVIARFGMALETGIKSVAAGKANSNYIHVCAVMLASSLRIDLNAIDFDSVHV